MFGIDLAYAAGIIDGEGYIGIHKRKRKLRYSESLSYSLEVSVVMVEKEIPDWLRLKFGGSVRKILKRKERKDVWCWDIWAKKARDFLIIIRPYLKIKQNQADLGIKFQEERWKSLGEIKSKESWNFEEKIYTNLKQLHSSKLVDTKAKG